MTARTAFAVNLLQLLIGASCAGSSAVAVDARDLTQRDSKDSDPAPDADGLDESDAPATSDQTNVVEDMLAGHDVAIRDARNDDVFREIAETDEVRPECLDPICPPDKPFPSGTGSGCYECYVDSHCSEPGEICDIVTHNCVRDSLPPCDQGRMRCSDRHCHECCQDDDCPQWKGPCLNGYCGNELDPCNDQCTDPFPRCAVIDSIPQCVQCVQDSDCQGVDSACYCSGDPTYSCMNLYGGICTCCGYCSSYCTSDFDCPPGPGGEETRCSALGGGFCYAPSGRCDGMDYCCGAGQMCFDPLKELELLFGRRDGWGAGVGACSCDENHPCTGGGVCHPIDDICLIPVVGLAFCPGGTKRDSLPEGICMELSQLLELVGP